MRKWTKKFLQPPARILEGGCGTGQNVVGLAKNGFDVWGVDMAAETIGQIKKSFPELKVQVQDVRQLDFSDNFFDGYWSLGVIEHFEHGFGDVLREAGRVLRPGGFLFLTFPWLSPLRRFKVRLGQYPIFTNDSAENFYEFILDEQKVREELEKYGFDFVKHCPFDAVKGLKDEINFLQDPFQKIYDGRSILAQGARFLLTVLLSFWAGHSILLIGRKR